MGLYAVVGTTPRNEITYQGADSDAYGDGLIGMFMDGFIRRLGPDDRLIANAATDFLALFHGGAETLAGCPDFFSGHIGGGGHQIPGIISERAQSITGCVCLVVHSFLLFGFVSFLGGGFPPRRNRRLLASAPLSESSFPTATMHSKPAPAL
jgi:hypothetical protein